MQSISMYKTLVVNDSLTNSCSISRTVSSAKCASSTSCEAWNWRGRKSMIVREPAARQVQNIAVAARLRRRQQGLIEEWQLNG